LVRPYTGVREEMIEKGVQAMIRVAMRILEKKSSTPTPRLMLIEGDVTVEELGDQPGP
jgi:hypothetical protein